MASVPPWMSADTFEYVLQFTEAHEGETNFMYNNWPAKSPTKDVTVGVGLSLRSENDAVRSDIIRLFKRKSDNEPASPEDMRAEFRRVNDTQRIGGNLYTAFRDPSPLYIPKSLMRPNLRENMLTFWDQRGSSANFPDFPTIPAQAQVALMSYNYGARISRAPKMCKAIKDGGSIGHILGETFKKETGLNIEHVGYKGSAPMITDLIAGRLSFSFDTLPQNVPHIKAEKLRPLAVTSRTRSHVAPDIPTVIEAKMPYLLAENFIGVSAPAQLPPAVLSKLHAAIQTSLDDPALVSRLNDLGLTVRKMSQAEFAAFVQQQVQGWAEPVKASGAKLN